MSAADADLPEAAFPPREIAVTRPDQKVKDGKSNLTAAKDSLHCSSCQEFFPKDHYSSKQIKRKGKRQCKSCVELSSPLTVKDLEKAPEGSFAAIYLANDLKGKLAKAVKASDVESAQSKLVKKEEDSPDNDRFDRLINWLKDGGAKFPHLILKYYTVDYRGVHARKRLDPDELILEVPLPLIMTSDVARDCEIGKRIQESGCQIRSSHSWLAAMLLQEKYKPDSKWRPYLDILPQHYRNMPIFFDDEELKELKGSFTLQMISDRKISLKSEYDNIASFVPEFKNYHYLDFFWARLAVITRIFGFKVGNHKTDGLVAMADMLNHKRPNETSWTFDNGRNAFTITTTKRLLKGSQIFDSYGRKCNSRYFVNYGFALDRNEDNQVSMVFTLPQDELRTMKVRMVGPQPRRFQIPFEHKEKITRKCFSYLRVAHADLTELVSLSQQKSIDKIGAISVRNEAQCIYHVAASAKEVLAGFDTTLDEDNKMLLDTEKKLTMNVRNCIVMRRGEKEVLHAYIDLAERIKHLEDKDIRYVKKYLAKEVTGRGKQPSMEWRLQNFFDDVWIPLMSGTKKEIEEMNNSLGV